MTKENGKHEWREWHVELKSVGGEKWASGAPEYVRVRRMLKAMLRSYGFRCAKVRCVRVALTEPVKKK